MFTDLPLIMLKNNKIVLFDIDHTIFDTDKYLKILNEKLSKELGYDGDEFIEKFKQIYVKIKKDSPYVMPEDLLEEILKHKKSKTNLKKLKEIFWEKKLYESCIYPDVDKAFSYLSDNDIKIGIFSTGTTKHQRIKIQSLKEYLSEKNIFISSQKIKIVKDTLHGYKDYFTYLIDDLPVVLHEAKKIDPNTFTIFIKRREPSATVVFPKDFIPDKVIENLDELIDIIKPIN